MTDDREILMPLIRRLGLDTLEGAFAYAGGDDLVKAGLGTRRRTQIKLQCDDGRVVRVYLKRYGRESLAAQLRRLFTYGLRKSPGCVEFDNIEQVRQAGIATMNALACGQQCGFVFCGRSYVIVTEVPGDALERSIDGFLARSDAAAIAAFTDKLADMTRKFHAAGLVHRDYYASHIFMHDSGGQIGLCLIDLARVFRPRWRKFRWRVKDLAQLKYSMPQRWCDECWYDFLAAYLGDEAAPEKSRYAAAIDARVARMRRRAQRPLGTRCG